MQDKNLDTNTVEVDAEETPPGTRVWTKPVFEREAMRDALSSTSGSGGSGDLTFCS